jgi:hypothetical protein
VDQSLIKEVFHNEESSEHKDFLVRQLLKSKQNLLKQVKQKIKQPILTDNAAD